MSAGLSENELSDSNGLFSNNEDEIYTFEEQGDSTEDEEYDFSLLAALEMGPYPFEHVAANGQSGSESALEEHQGEEIQDCLTLPGMRTNRRALFWSLLSFITENGMFIIMRTVRMYDNCYIARVYAVRKFPRTN